MDQITRWLLADATFTVTLSDWQEQWQRGKIENVHFYQIKKNIWFWGVTHIIWHSGRGNWITRQLWKRVCAGLTDVGKVKGKLECLTESKTMCQALMDEGAADLTLCLRLSQDVSEESAYLWQCISLQGRVVLFRPLATRHRHWGQNEGFDLKKKFASYMCFLTAFQLLWPKLGFHTHCMLRTTPTPIFLREWLYMHNNILSLSGVRCSTLSVTLNLLSKGKTRHLCLYSAVKTQDALRNKKTWRTIRAWIKDNRKAKTNLGYIIGGKWRKLYEFMERLQTLIF